MIVKMLKCASRINKKLINLKILKIPLHLMILIEFFMTLTRDVYQVPPTKRCSGQGIRLLHQKSWVRIPGKAWMSNCPPYNLLVTAFKNWLTGGSKFISRSPFSTQPFGFFSGFLRNSRKYELGSFRKTLTEDSQYIGLGPS